MLFNSYKRVKIAWHILNGRNVKAKTLSEHTVSTFSRVMPKESTFRVIPKKFMWLYFSRQDYWHFRLEWDFPFSGGRMNRNQEDMVFSTKLNQNIGKRKKEEDRSHFAFLQSPSKNLSLAGCGLHKGWENAWKIIWIYSYDILLNIL